MLSLFSFFAFLAAASQGHVLENSKSAETTTLLPSDLKVHINETVKKVNSENKRVYLDDVVYALKNQYWNKEEEYCLNRTLLLLNNLQNYSLWAVWDWDSISSEPLGILFGNQYQLGNFDECVGAPWTKQHPELKTQYCLAEITLERTDNIVKRRIKEPLEPYQSALDYIQFHRHYSRPLNELIWGVCVPSSCTPRSVERLLITLIARSHLGTAGMKPRIIINEPCQEANETKSYDGPFYGFVALIFVLMMITLSCTIALRMMSNSKSIGFEMLKACSLEENAAKLLASNDEGLEVIYGIRFLTICLIVMDHQIGIFNSAPISNGVQVDRQALSAIGLFLLHDDLFVDTFFLMSGFLTFTAFVKFRRFPNPIIMIAKRYVRLVTAFAVVIFYVSAVFPYTGSGPLWPRAVAGEVDTCKKNWWLSLLMLSNYIDSENICMVSSWYIPCDFHYFVVVTILYWLYQHRRGFAIICAGVVTVAAVVTPGAITYISQLPAVQLFTYEFVRNPRASEQFHLTYIKSHARAAAYIVGFISGYIFYNYNTMPTGTRISKKWATIGTYAGVIIMLLVMMAGPTFLMRSYHPLEGAVYAALNRPVWACGVAMVILCCSLGHVPLVKSFLSWSPWVPLSRLAYGLYLTHTTFITRNVYVTRNPNHNDYANQLNSSAGVIFWGCVTAFIMWLLVEAPANNLLSMCFTPRKKSKSPEGNSDDIRSYPSCSGVGNEKQINGYLQGNLPKNIQVSSKI